jgi:hypothetical protein
MQIRCLNCVEKIYLQLWYALVFLETKMRSPKWPRKIIYLISDLSAKQAFRGPCILAPWSELDFPYVQIEALNKAHNFGSQHLTIRGHLSPRICIGRSWCFGLCQYLSGWIDLMSKSPNHKTTLGHLELCSLRVLTYVRLHYLLISAQKHHAPKTICKSDLLYQGG